MKTILHTVLLSATLLATGCAATGPAAAPAAAAPASAAMPAAANLPASLLPLHEQASKGDAEAQFRLGHALANPPRGLYEADYAAAAAWLRRAADQNHPAAAFHLATMYAQGLGVKQDFAEAVRLHMRSAELGHVEALYPVAYALEIGIGVPKDEAKALEWYRRSAAAGVHHAMTRLARAYDRAELGLAPDPDLAAEWRAKAKNQRGGERQINVPVSK